MEALLDGHRIKKDGEIYILSDDRCLCVERTKEQWPRGMLVRESKVWLKVGFGSVTIGEFIKWVESFTDAEFAENMANVGLTKIKQAGL